MKKAFKFAALVTKCIFSILLILHSCTHSPIVDGGGEIGNPVIVMGAICDSSGTGIADVDLLLIDTSVSDPQKLIADSCIRTRTGLNGTYQFLKALTGHYNLFGYTSNNEKMLLKRIDPMRDKDLAPNEEQTFNQGTDTIRSSATIVVKVDSNLSSDGNFIFVPNTTIRIPIDSSGEYLVKCPASNIDVVLFSNDTQKILGENLSPSAGQWLDLTQNHYTIPKPVIFSGVDTGETGRNYQFSLDSIDIGPNHPVQYRFDWGDSFSIWDFAVMASHTWNYPGIYGVRVQARSLRDTASVSEWSDSSLVTIE